VSASAPRAVPATARLPQVDQVNVFAILSMACYPVLRDRASALGSLKVKKLFRDSPNWAYSSAG
jgi:hypothetical protein